VCLSNTTEQTERCVCVHEQIDKEDVISETDNASDDKNAADVGTIFRLPSCKSGRCNNNREQTMLQMV